MRTDPPKADRRKQVVGCRLEGRAAMHRSVMMEEVLRFLEPAPDGTVVDGTLGLGGHAARILQGLGPQGRLVGFDRDPQALEAAAKVLTGHENKTMLIRDDFKNMAARLGERGIREVNAILLDLGVSSAQLETPSRGFSFQVDGPLDMRMDPGSGVPPASEIVNRATARELESIFRLLGEERFARRIAATIVDRRRLASLRTTRQLASIIEQCVPPRARHMRLHPATRVFLALRLAVNRELDSLRDFLTDAPRLLSPRGRLVILTFHSLEDRIVKRAFRAFEREGLGRALTKKPLEPSDAEVRANPRARSAKLRAFEKAGAR